MIDANRHTAGNLIKMIYPALTQHERNLMLNKMGDKGILQLVDMLDRLPMGMDDINEVRELTKVEI